ncbi:DUF2268 domain-containing putative Zn-dependent protease [uncultured Paracoccus sp.]|uniref:DUF2268 domain-containing putative Zn-dependent protease n=1 Tax=uncultured Paracoccus sp. TaxID=189685 RepID=UPI00261FBD79|nr:DUF2268 domain-containing putative Zn-dependent protease [uncultured Paracoccus sp.]
MTIWTIHFLNTRHALTPIMPEIRAAAREAIAQAEAHADLPRFDLVIRGQAGGGIPDWGVGGHAPAPGLIEVTLNPARFDPALLMRTLVHELHHLIRWDGPGYGKSLGEALVSEGLAGHFVLQVLGGRPDPWDATTPSAGLAKRALTEWSRLQYDHAEWFFGKGKIRKWTGYGLGHRLLAEHLAQNPDQDAVTLAMTRADSFREAMRRLAKADGAEIEEIEQIVEAPMAAASEETDGAAAVTDSSESPAEDNAGRDLPASV